MQIKHKKKLVALALGAIAYIGAPALITPSDASVAEAARGGARISAPKAAPSAPKAAPSAPKSNAAATQQKTGPNQNEYKPSQKADQIQKDAPAANTAATARTNTAAPQTSASPWGGMMRNIGLLAGGMLLGSLLTSFLGGSPFMADVLGLLANVAIFALIFMAIRLLWSKFRGRKEENVYASSMSSERARIDVPSIGQTASARPAIPSVGGETGGDYDAKSMADRYRNR